MLAALAGLVVMSQTAFRPPAVPLVVHNPFFSTWSMTDKLTADWPKHWSGSVTAMAGLARIDGKPYRWMGPDYLTPNAMRQTGVEVTPTRSIYSFEQDGVALQIEFLSPLLANDLERLGRPATYITAKAASADGKAHDVQLYLDVTGEWCVSGDGAQVVANRFRLMGDDVLALGASNQNPLSRSGDRTKIDWGTLFLAPPRTGNAMISSHTSSRQVFLQTGRLSGTDDMRFPRAASDDWPVLAVTMPLGPVSSAAISQTITIAYDEKYAIESFKRKLPPFWARRDGDPGQMLSAAVVDFRAAREASIALDEQILGDASKLGGDAFARVCAMAYRQCLAAHGLVEDFDGDLMHFSKENTSNGCIATVDVTFPASPFFLYFNPKLLEAQIKPVLEYSSSPRWKFPFAPHDLGQYPLANGQVYGGGERTEENQMPVEETANMLIMALGLAHEYGNADLSKEFWPTLTKWAGYLEKEGFDPKNQLCTDDFSGHLAHNTNLSIKAIIALGAYGKLAEMVEGKGRGKKWLDLAAQWAKDWAAKANDGDHFRLAFDQPNTWSMKYNLMWDKALGLNLFAASTVNKELDSYKARINKYGIPLDNRATFTKTDWLLWVAAMARDRAEFDAMVGPVSKWLNETPSRVPFTDWYDTKDGRNSGFAARSVIGGVFAPLYMQKALARQGRLK